MGNQIIKKVYERRAAIKQAAEVDANTYEQQVIETDVEYFRLLVRYRSMVLENAKIMSMYSETKSMPPNAMLMNAFANLENYKISKGYDFSPKYQCSHCNDTLMVDGNACNCIRQEIKQAIMSECGINASYQRTFADSNLSIITDDAHRDKLEKLYNKYSDYVDAFKRKSIGYKPRNTMFLGSAGLGKTFLMECVCSDANAKGLVGLYFKAFELNEYFIKIYKAGSDAKAMWDLILKADILFIDDLGTEAILQKITLESLFNLIDYRYSYNKPFFISSNLSLDEIRTRYNERISSRILDTTKTDAYKFDGYDLRLVRNND